jgi:hypothetical protein
VDSSFFFPFLFASKINTVLLLAAEVYTLNHLIDDGKISSPPAREPGKTRIEPWVDGRERIHGVSERIRN